MFRLLNFMIFLITVPLVIFANYDLSICAIFKDEAPYLKEWIEFHKLQGVEHFYLYNNNSSDHYKKVLRPYIENKTVTLVQWKYNFESGDRYKWLEIQSDAYTDCIKEYGKKSNWIAFIDADEFLYCVNGERLPSFLRNYKSYGGVCAHWLLFGTSDVEEIPQNSLMIELLIKCSEKKHERNGRIKSIVQPKHVTSCKSAHYFNYKSGYYHVDEHYKRYSDQCPISHDKIRINHYWTRTKKDFEERKMPSRINRRNFEDPESLQARADEYNKSTDTVIQQFVPALRKKMGYN